MQLRYSEQLTLEGYLKEKAWERASAKRCPLHPQGKCGYCRHGTYVRKIPEPIPIARAYCPQGHTTFSFLPDFLASRLPGTLDEVEQTAVQRESSPSLAQAAERLRPATAPWAVSSTSAERWVARRVALFKTVLLAVVGLFADRLAGTTTATELRGRLCTEHALVMLRERSDRWLAALPAPLGFGPRRAGRRRRAGVFQHDLGPDPPESAR